MGKDLQVSPVAAARRSRTPRSIAARADLHYPADRLYWPHMTPALHECEPHGRWLAKNCVAFFNISLSSFKIRFSRRSRSFSRAKSACGAATRSLGRYCDIHLCSVDLPTPKSDATRSRGKPLVSAIRTASSLNSSVCLIISQVSLNEHYALKRPAQNRYKSSSGESCFDESRSWYASDKR